jgi:hypothetical protein
MIADWLSNTVLKAAEEADLPRPVIDAFDGDSWVWIWRAEVTYSGGPAIAEVAFRARPDPRGEGFQTETSALAWDPVRRERSWTRTYESRYLESKRFGSDPQAMDAIHQTLSENFRIAMGDATYAARWSLDETNARRQNTVDELRRKGIFVP